MFFIQLITSYLIKIIIVANTNAIIELLENTNMNMVSERNVKKSEKRLSKAEIELNSASRLLGRQSNKHPSSVLSSTQDTIEHCAKAIFILMEVHEPEEHAIPVDSHEGEQLINAVNGELGEGYAKETARILFLSELYNTTYPAAEYGVKIAQVRFEADEFLSRMEGDQSYNHAVEVAEITRAIIDTAREKIGMKVGGRDSLIDYS